ncbi:MAG TPA: hypothetical protein VIT64_08190 [Ilumatobacteraceae bacterium]
MGASEGSGRNETTRVRVGAISVVVPAQLVSASDAPIDSPAAVLSGGGITVIIDQGPFADRMESSVGRPDRREEPMHVAGVTGRIVSFRTPEEHTYTVAAVLSEPARVTVVVRADDSVPEHEARRIVESLQPVASTGREEEGDQHE